MKAHILGNGPSIDLFESDGEYTIGCNFQKVPVDVSVVLDCRPFMVYKGNRSLLPNNRIITSRYAYPTIQEQGLDKEFDILYMIPMLEQYVSAAHIATQWALDHDYTEIHLWGCDSIWQDTQETRTDELVPRNRLQFDLYMHWREKWQPYKNFNIIVHNTKEGTLLKDLL